MCIYLIQLLLTISNFEAILSHNEWAYVWNLLMENFGYIEVACREFVVSGASVITRRPHNEAILKVPGTSLYPASTVYNSLCQTFLGR